MYEEKKKKLTIHPKKKSNYAEPTFCQIKRTIFWKLIGNFHKKKPSKMVNSHV